MSVGWPIDTAVYTVVERIDGYERLLAVYAEDSIEQALDYGRENFTEFHAADPGSDTCVFLRKQSNVRLHLG